MPYAGSAGCAVLLPASGLHVSALEVGDSSAPDGARGAPHWPSATPYGAADAGGQVPLRRRPPCPVAMAVAYPLKRVLRRTCPPPCRVGAPGFAPTRFPAASRPKGLRLAAGNRAAPPPGAAWTCSAAAETGVQAPPLTLLPGRQSGPEGPPGLRPASRVSGPPSRALRSGQ